MLLLKILTLTLIVYQPFLVLSKSILSEAITYALNCSFNEKIHILHIVIETDFNDTREVFFDEIDNILAKNWNFRLLIDVNNLDGKVVSDHNLWFIDSHEAFLRLFPWIEDYHRNSQLFFFIVLKSSKQEDHFNVIEEIFSDFLELSIANVNVITENTSVGEVSFYTFFPYQELNCQSAKPFKTHRFKIDSIKPNDCQFFAFKADNLHGCPLRIRTRNELILILGGYELSYQVVNYAMSVLELVLVKEFAIRMNFSFEILNATMILNNTEVVAPEAHDLTPDRKTELVIGFFQLNYLDERFFSKSVSYYLSWLVISLHPQPNKLHTKGYWLFVAFNYTTWICIVAFFTIIFGSLFVISRNQRYPRGLELLTFALGTSMGHLSSRWNSVRFSFIALSLGTMVLRAAYQGKLFDAYRGQKMLETPHSIKDLFAQNYTICAHSYYHAIINELNGLEYPNFRTIQAYHGINLFDDKEKLALVASFGFIFTFNTEENCKKLFLEPVLMEIVCMFFKKHSIIQPKIDEIIMKMEEAGILPYLRRSFENIDDIGFDQDQKMESEPKSLVLQQFAFTFWLWVGLCGISFLVFIGELLWQRFK
ncbi:uncharacterized protein LOC129944112 [Eupeodes corollae]|uniref:uncharacterized protein LOC129944112 n=1 Tax=Eupeodes corollae TaxID=290404 RepID=UPI00248F6D99|nr:uncharacterized protein LOC129944112 [Eupeodes corollae]